MIYVDTSSMAVDTDVSWFDKDLDEFDVTLIDPDAEEDENEATPTDPGAVFSLEFCCIRTRLIML